MRLTMCLLLAAIAACDKDSGSSKSGSDLKVGFVTDTGKINDGTFNQSAYEGGIRAAKDFGLTFDYREALSADNIKSDIEYFIDQDYDMIITTGFLVGEVTKEMAGLYPDVKFAIVDVAYDEYSDNLMGLAFAEDQAGYLAGAVAAKVTSTKSVGVVGGVAVPPVKRFVNGFVNGVLDNCADCTPKCSYIDSFTAPDKGRDVAIDMITKDNTDVIFGAGGQTGSGGILEATKRDVWAIGVDTDEYFTTFKDGAETSSTKLITSAIKKIDESVYQAIKKAVDGTFTAGTLLFDASNGGIGLSDFHAAEIDSSILKEINEILVKLAGGTITSGVDADGENIAHNVSCEFVTVGDTQ